jgi:hypothetical protein
MYPSPSKEDLHAALLRLRICGADYMRLWLGQKRNPGNGKAFGEKIQLLAIAFESGKSRKFAGHAKSISRCT